MVFNRLFKIMEKSDLTTEKLHEDTKISKNTIHLMKYNKSKGVDFKTLDKLCKYFKCDIGDILEYKEEQE